MKLYRILIVVLLIGSSGIVSAQINYQQQYLNAKSLFSEGEYALATEAFKPLIQREPDNPFAAYASYYLGLSTYRAGYAARAKEIMVQTKERFPNWSKIDEVNYWLAIMYFENEDNFLALNTVKQIKDPQLAVLSEGMTYEFLTKNTDVRQMESLYNSNKNNVTGRVYASKLSAVPLDADGRKSLENLIKEYGLNPDKYLASVQTSEVKDSYKVAVLMPFLIESLKPNDKKRVNEFVLDLYNGIRLGFDSLRNIGIDIQVFAYDTKRDSSVTREILNKDELKGMDAIIGPLFPEPSKIVNEFSQKNKINAFNPLSSVPDYLNTNPFYFLYKPSVLTIGEIMADFSMENFGDKPGMVIYGETPNDKLIAQAYVDRMAEKEVELAMVKEIGKGDSREVLDLLLTTGNVKDVSTEEGRAEMSIGLDSIGHIFVASNNSLIFSKVVSAVETRGDKIKVIGAAEWMDMPVVKFEVFERLGVTFYAPGYVDHRSANYHEFRNRYLRKHRKAPTEYAEIGFELALMLGNNLGKYGTYPQVEWEHMNIIPGGLTPGFKYNASQDNLILPVLQFGDNGLEMRVRQKTTLDEN